MAKGKLQEIIVRGGPRENSQYGSGDGNPMSPYSQDYQVRNLPWRFYEALLQQDFQITIEMMIPPDKCGLIIGKGGNTLKTMMQEHSVKLHLVQVSCLEPLSKLIAFQDSAEITKDEKPLKIIGTRQQV